MSKRKPSKSDCHGCRDDFYNQNGNSTSGECWSLKAATFERARFVHINMCPPWDGVKIENKPNCYRKPQFVRIRVECDKP